MVAAYVFPVYHNHVSFVLSLITRCVTSPSTGVYTTGEYRLELFCFGNNDELRKHVTPSIKGFLNGDEGKRLNPTPSLVIYTHSKKPKYEKKVIEIIERSDAFTLVAMSQQKKELNTQAMEILTDVFRDGPLISVCYDDIDMKYIQAATALWVQSLLVRLCGNGKRGSNIQAHVDLRTSVHATEPSVHLLEEEEDDDEEEEESNIPPLPLPFSEASLDEPLDGEAIMEITVSDHPPNNIAIIEEADHTPDVPEINPAPLTEFHLPPVVTHDEIMCHYSASESLADDEDSESSVALPVLDSSILDIPQPVEVQKINPISLTVELPQCSSSSVVSGWTRPQRSPLHLLFSEAGAQDEDEPPNREAHRALATVFTTSSKRQRDEEEDHSSSEPELEDDEDLRSSTPSSGEESVVSPPQTISYATYARLAFNMYLAKKVQPKIPPRWSSPPKRICHPSNEKVLVL